MSLFDALFGRTRLKRPKMDHLFALTTASVDLESRGVRLEPRAAISYRPVETPNFSQAEGEARSALDLYASEHAVEVSRSKDSFGFSWTVVKGGGDPDDRVTTLHVLADILTEQGFGGELLAAVFPGKDHHGDAFYLVYNYKRGAYYPFRPLDGRERDNAAEIRLQSLLSGVLPVEKDQEMWYALWDLPL